MTKIISSQIHVKILTPVDPNTSMLFHYHYVQVIGQTALQNFQTEMAKAAKDPYQVVMRKTGLPVTLLNEKAKHSRVHILDTQSFEDTFGKKASR